MQIEKLVQGSGEIRVTLLNSPRRQAPSFGT